MRLAPKARSGAGRREAPTRSGAAGVAVGNRTDLGAYFSEGFFAPAAEPETDGENDRRGTIAAPLQCRARRSRPHRFRRPPDPCPIDGGCARANGGFAAGRRQCATRSAKWRGAERRHAKGERIRSAHPAIPQAGRCAGALRNRPRSSHAAIARRRARTSPIRPCDTLCCPCVDRSRPIPVREAAGRFGRPLVVIRSISDHVTALFFPHPGVRRGGGQGQEGSELHDHGAGATVIALYCRVSRSPARSFR